MTQVCCTLDSSLLLARDGTLYSVGDNSLGQLGRSPTEATAAGEWQGPERWIVRAEDGLPLRAHCIAAGLGHCLAVTDSGQVSAACHHPAS
jgi:alpha-tubulin suppressor-like RCC1 family protein